MEQNCSKYQALVCIPGVDSFYDSSPLKLFDFLFPSFRSAEVKSYKVEEDDVMEDVLLSVTENCLLIYCNPSTIHKLFSESTGGYRIRYYCLDAEKVRFIDLDLSSD